MKDYLLIADQVIAVVEARRKEGKFSDETRTEIAALLRGSDAVGGYRFRSLRPEVGRFSSTEENLSNPPQEKPPIPHGRKVGEVAVLHFPEIPEFVKWLKDHVSLCGHGYISVTCGQCMAPWIR